jgi:hypothetical protein
MELRSTGACREGYRPRRSRSNRTSKPTRAPPCRRAASHKYACPVCQAPASAIAAASTSRTSIRSQAMRLVMIRDASAAVVGRNDARSQRRITCRTPGGLAHARSVGNVEDRFPHAEQRPLRFRFPRHRPAVSLMEPRLRSRSCRHNIMSVSSSKSRIDEPSPIVGMGERPSDRRHLIGRRRG